MPKKDLLIGGWVGVGQLLVAARQTVQCINNRVFVITSFKMANFTNVELTDMVLLCDAADDNAVQAQILYREQFPQKVVPNS
jgi:hypothetical protein